MAFHGFGTKAGLICAVALVGCNKSEPASDLIARQKADAVGEQITYLETRLSAVERSPETLSLADSGYSVVETDIGRLTVEWLKSEKLGAGSRLTFKIGNPTTATITRAQASLLLKDAAGKPLGKIARPAFNGDIKSGTWNTVTVAINDYAPDRIAKIDVLGLYVENITLFTR